MIKRLGGQSFILFALLLAMLPATPAGGEETQASPASTKSTELVWPLPPNEPMVKYLDMVSSNLDVEPPKKRSWFQKLLNEEDTTFRFGLGRPMGIAVDSKDRIYVTDLDKRAVVVFDRAGKKTALLGAQSRGRLSGPFGIEIDRNDNVYVSDVRLKQVHVYDAEWNLTASISKVGKETIMNPTGLALDEARKRLIITDSRAHKVHVVSLNNLSQGTSFGVEGDDDSDFYFPSFAAVDKEGRIYVSDTMNFCVKVFDKDFKFLRRIGEHGTAAGMFDRPKGIAVDSKGYLYVVDAAFSSFQVFDPEGNVLFPVGFFGRGRGEFRLPAGIYIDRKDRIYVTDQYNRRIQIMQALGGRVDPAAKAVENQ